MENGNINLFDALKECFMAEVWGHDNEKEGYENVENFINYINQLEVRMKELEEYTEIYKHMYYKLHNENHRNKKAEEES